MKGANMNKNTKQGYYLTMISAVLVILVLKCFWR